MGKSVWLPELGRLTARRPALPSLSKQGNSGVPMPSFFWLMVFPSIAWTRGPRRLQSWASPPNPKSEPERAKMRKTGTLQGVLAKLN